MENLEEVLQALDEFQKMRPTVIPQELEDYLCWVAKTGDPVYQWSLIKTLFREKLTRVMTDFYESCPSLELATCPNVEHFNYDTMKSSLLERLESFANAPFTVQRICELLTAPRKEYNRVDKFMRAIEKNILVVSTREPGPIARRGETGDGMVNGSVEEDTASIMQQQPPPPPLSLSPSPSSSLSSSSSPSPSSSPSASPSPSPSSSPLPSPSSSALPSLSQPQLQSPPQSPSQLPQTTQPAQTGQPNSQDVEMEYWEKDCTSTVTISVHTVVENETPLLHSGVIPTVGSQLTKSIFTASEATREKLEQVTPRTEIAASNYVPATSDFSTISNLTSQAQSQESVSTVSAVVPVVQNLPAETTGSDDSLVGSTDLAEAIMNEDTTSQLNLDLESEEIEAAATATTTTTTTATTTATTSTSATTTVTVVATVIPLTTDTTQKLQAAFQAKHFESDDNKCLEKSNEKTPVSSTIEEGIGHSMKDEETTKSKPECMDSNEMSHNESRLIENSSETDTEMRSDALADNAESVSEERISNKPEEEETSMLEDVADEHLRSRVEEDTKGKTAVFVESQSAEKDGAVTSDECAVIVSSGDALYKAEKTETHSTETSTTISLKESFTHDQSISQKAEIIEVMDKVLEAVPKITSSNGNNDGQEIQDTEFNTDNLKMMEIINEKMSLTESAMSDPISVIEKPKEVTSVIEKLELVSPTVEMTESSDNISYQKDDDPTDIQDDGLANVQGNKMTCVIKENQSSVIESAACRREHVSMELMEVDDEESLSTFQQDEPMEQETMDDLSKS